MAVNKFGWVDYVVFVALWCISMGIGLYHAFARGGQRTISKYFVGNRELNLFPVALSIAASLVSTNTMLGASPEIYYYGCTNFFIVISVLLATIIVAFAIVPLFQPLKFTSVNEYFELRFNSKLVRIFGVLVMLIGQILYVGTVIFGPAIALDTVTGIPVWGSILLVSVIGTFYTTVGGMTAVVWTDVFQTAVMLAGILAVITLGILNTGGFNEVWKMNQDWGHLKISITPDPTERVTVWVSLIGYTLFNLGFIGVNQPSVQRFCAMKSQNKATMCVILNGMAFATLVFLAGSTGFVIFGYYADKGCDPYESGQIRNPNQILPFFVLEVLNYPGIPGLFTACMLSGSLSTLSSSINSMTAVLWEDIMKQHMQHLSPGKQTLITKIIAVIFGGICMGIAFLVLKIGGNLLQISISFLAVCLGPLLGLVLLGALFPWSNWLGALGGGVCSLAINFWLLTGQTLYRTQRVRLPLPTYGCSTTRNLTAIWPSTEPPFYNVTTLQQAADSNQEALNPALRWLYSVSFGWYTLIAVIISMLVGILVSLVTGLNDPQTTDARFYFMCLQKKYGIHTKEETEEIDKISKQGGEEESHIEKY